MGRRAGRKRPTRRQKIALADTRRVTNPNPPGPRMVACGVRRAGGGCVVSLDFGHFRVDTGRQPVSSARGNDGGVPGLDRMSDMGRCIVVALADRMGCSPSEIVEGVKG